ncbi:hypothetical protein N7491_009569 [Penicillium cf. griseofulvum]|uniref:Uncharacterized protein n=1 Tax=Penicillium cf. griseofulvum TaxID=2972120 RepID=A0A9W9JMD8_9EURO|nr:hypothetical protein N7472_004837 [Penicillium cf. griseofulvum]KAJ5424353.1 hypothetical protein N7491_009569 [Penicillium cf. griseofulvum]KAJ5442405.1 hypothetical protein N7445_005412 [Penicillium cf. griseofulvum]
MTSESKMIWSRIVLGEVVATGGAVGAVENASLLDETWELVTVPLSAHGAMSFQRAEYTEKERDDTRDALRP